MPNTPAQPLFINRRQFERFAMTPMYTSIALRTLDEETFEHEGHAYDISEGGMQFELDRGFEPGSRVVVRIDLPDQRPEQSGDTGPGRALFVFANVVWMDDSDAGPVRLAVAFTNFARAGDRERLLRHMSRRALRRAA
ncbi:MAG: PilZ domain-containing protein [Phycisphaerae bacterium]|nr:PilZ domain-containing protein [Phycisphaerae bacterium]